MERCSNMELVAEIGPFQDVGIYWCKICGGLLVEGEDTEPTIPEQVSGGWWGCPGSKSYESHAASQRKFQENLARHREEQDLQSKADATMQEYLRDEEREKENR